MPSDTPSSFIPLSVPDLSGNEAAYLAECVSSSWVSTAGPFVGRFEKMVADYIGVPHAVATASGTAALHVALLVAGVQPGDEVLVSTLTFIAPANAIRYVGAYPVFIDADERDWQMDVGLAVEFLTQECEQKGGGLFNKNSGRRIGAILPVHILGSAVDMAPLLEVARRLNIPVVEDATEGLGAKYDGKQLGTLGDIGCFSFNGNKLVTCGGGGMVVTPNGRWAAAAEHLTTQAKTDSIESIHDQVGFNYRLTNLQAAVGCAQMERIDHFIGQRKALAAQYQDLCKALDGVTFMPIPDGVYAVNWLSAISLTNKNRREVLISLRELGIETRPLWQPLHQSPAHQGVAIVGGGIAEKLQEKVLCLPSSSAMLESEKASIFKALCGVMA